MAEHFVDRHRGQLIGRVTSVKPLLDLLHGKVLSEEQYQTVLAGATSFDQMRKLFTYSLSWDRDCKNLLYQAMRKIHPQLVAELDGQPWEGVSLAEDYREKYLKYVRWKFRYLEERNARLGEKVALEVRYTPLLLVEEHRSLAQRQHELLALGRQPTSWVSRRVHVEALFDPDAEGLEPPLTVVLQGSAGIGKTVLARKVMLDWAAGTLYPGRFDFAFYVHCRELNLERKRSAVQLIQQCCDDDGVPLSEICRRSDRLLFLVDGFDELGWSSGGWPGAADDDDDLFVDWKDKRPVGSLLAHLIRKRLFPKASLLITTRPAAAESLRPLLRWPRRAEILGFSEAERAEYFHHYFLDSGRANRALAFIQENDVLFTMCFVPLICWIVCTGLRQQMDRREDLAQASKTTTAVYLSFLSSLLRPARHLPSRVPPAHLRGLCSLAADGILSQRILFRKADLRKHGLPEDGLSAFLHVDVFEKDVDCETLFSFVHLTFQEFFAALFYLLGPDETGPGPLPDARTLLQHYRLCDTGFLTLTVRFFFGLLNRERVADLKATMDCVVRPEARRALVEWIDTSARKEALPGPTLQWLYCFYEIQEVDFVERAMGSFRKIDIDVRTRMDQIVVAFCLRNSRNLCSIELMRFFNVAEADAAAAAAERTPEVAADRRPQDWLQDTLCESLSEASANNRGLTHLALRNKNLGRRGAELLSKGLSHPNCKLKSLRLVNCLLTPDSCRDFSSILSTDRNLSELDLSSNALKDSGLSLLCEGLRHPSCKLQTLWLQSCALTSACGPALSSLLTTSANLTKLDLFNNALGDTGVSLICEGLKHPNCKLQALLLRHCALTLNCCPDLSSVLSINRDLSELDLSYNSLEDAGVCLLCEGLRHPNCKLQTLRLQKCKLTSRSCSDLSQALGINRELRELILHDNVLGDAGISVIWKGIQQPSCGLKILRLGKTHFSEKMEEEMRTVQKMKPELKIRFH
ncbi:NACHT, LRR and PYD domains-containing protein 3-like [Ornithorhynchus anatinus]|uniref:NLR family pyrin domain containing 12 n=1 Tax=Ornithorhynchus anatinus TaxID=9258 RepID=F6R6M1_ORNAN|nr:NACHT, LRR and PYD domains-containing protein 3-like [Ornithorhynchus anatinus]